MRLWFVLLGCVPIAAAAAEKTYKYDQYSESISLAATQLAGNALAVQAGYETGEAFGQIYKPALQDYPVRILGIDLVLAEPPNLPGGKAEAQIEIYAGDGDGPAPPTTEPIFKISTAHLFNTSTMTDGQPLVGNTAMSITFDQDSPENHPPLIASGNIWVMIRYQSEATSLADAWGVITCDKDFMGVQIGCGCQQVGTFHDQSTTPAVNVLHQAKACDSAATDWNFMEGIGVTGDLIMRLRAEVAVTPTDPPDTDPTDPAEGGDTEPGDPTPPVEDDDTGPTMNVTSVSPPTVYTDEDTDILIAGDGFQTGVRVLVGTDEVMVKSLTGDGLILATISAGLRPGMYTIAVINPDQDTASLGNALEVLARPEESGCHAAPASLAGLAAVLGLLARRRRCG